MSLKKKTKVTKKEVVEAFKKKFPLGNALSISGDDLELHEAT